MRTWREMFKSLTMPPRGYSADGRRLGLGLATAMEKQRQKAHLDVEEYLRRNADADRQVETTA